MFKYTDSFLFKKLKWDSKIKFYFIYKVCDDLMSA